ncbi:MAG: hypothetical protein ACO4AU_14210, partial [bacterium]
MSSRNRQVANFIGNDALTFTGENFLGSRNRTLAAAFNISQNFEDNWTSGVSYEIRDLVRDPSNQNIYICKQTHTSQGGLPLKTNADLEKWGLLIDAESTAVVLAHMGEIDTLAKGFDGKTSADPGFEIGQTSNLAAISTVAARAQEVQTVALRDADIGTVALRDAD